MLKIFQHKLYSGYLLKKVVGYIFKTKLLENRVLKALSVLAISSNVSSFFSSL